MPVVLGIIGAVALLGIGYAVFGGSSTSTPPAGGVWQALRTPFTIAPGASVVMVEMQNQQPGYPAGVTPLGATLSSMAAAGNIVGYQAFAPGATLPSDWPSADTYGPTALRYEFTYPATLNNAPGAQPNTPLTLSTPPLAAWQVVPA